MPKAQPIEIHSDQAGFTLTAPNTSERHASLEWRDVNAVLAYKRDLYAVDLICLGFVTPEGTIEVHEDMQGWSDMLEQLPSRIHGIPPYSDWWERVAKPPFASCVTKLFERVDREGF